MTKLGSAIIAVLLATAMAAPALAYHRKTPALLQIAPNGGGTIANPRWAGFRYVFFDSDADLLGNGSSGRQVFFFDLQARDRTGDLSITQLTSGNGDNRGASADGHGRTIAFDALPGGVGPRQIMVANRFGAVPFALTNGVADSVHPIVDDGGHFVVFESQADLLGAGYTGTQIYLVDLRVASATCPFPCPATGNAGLRQITHKAGTSTNPVVSKGGGVVAFESDGDLLNTGETTVQIYVFALKTSLLTSPTHGPGASRHPALSRKGNLLAFESDADLLGAGSGGTQIFIYNPLENTLQQLTAASGAQSTSPSVETTGRGVIFASNADLLGNGSTGRQIFEYNLKTVSMRQVTDTSGSPHDPAYSAGVFNVFLSSGDLLGNGSSGDELYLINLFALTGSVP